MTKALAILKEGLDFMNQAIKVNPNSVKELQSEIDRYVEAIDELEELNNRSCLSCVFAYRDKNKKIDDVQGQILGSKARWSYCKKLMLNVTKDFCCNRY